MSYRYSRDRRQPGTYHAWVRATGGAAMFRDDDDRREFEWLLKRYLSTSVQFDSRGRPYENLRDQVRLYACTILTSHFHLILWQKTPDGIDRLMRGVMNSYTRYFNRKYGESGTPFPGPFRSRRIVGRKKLLWRIAYVQANHKRLRLDWEFSSHRYFIDEDPPSWIEVASVIGLFGGREKYDSYMRRYLRRAALDEDLREDEPQL